MKISASSVFAAAALVLGSPLPRDAPAGVVAVDFVRQPAPSPLARRAAAPISDPLQNKQYFYLAALQIGTPPQSQQGLIDTGSSDLWVYGIPSGEAGAFDTSKSSTYQLVNKGGFSITYGSGAAQGDWVRDTVAVGGAAVQNALFAVSNQKSGNLAQGIFGIGLTADETNSASAVGGEYPNFPALLKNTGLVQRNAYSLYLNSEEATDGTLLFGGIDTAKFEGKLNRVKLVESTEFAVDFQFYGETLRGVLDSGTSALLVSYSSYFAALNDIRAAVPNLQYSLSGSIYVTSPDDVPEGKSIKVTVGGVAYDVWLKNLFTRSGTQAGDTNYYLDLQPYVPNPVYLLGDPFLRSVYIVYDLEGGEVGIAPVKYTDESSITAIPASGIPANL